MIKRYALDTIWGVQSPTSIVLAIQDILFKVQLDCKEKVYF